MMRTIASILLTAFLGLTLPAATAEAYWLAKLFKEAGEVGGDAASTTGRLGLGALDEAAGVVRRLPKPEAGRLALAAHATPEGHWTFTNGAGQSYTAANSDEMARVARSLAPEAADDVALSLYITGETAFQRPRLLDDLPAQANLHLVHGGDSFPLVRRGAGEASEFAAQLRANVLVPLANPADFGEAVYQLGRGLDRSSIRVIALKPGGSDTLLARPRFDRQRGVPLVDEIDPSRLSDALSGLGRQTVLVTARIKGDLLEILTGSGETRTVSLRALEETAAAHDVNFVVLHTAQPVQPGSQTWLWQTIEVAGLERALKQPTYGDFLDAIGARRGRLVVSAYRPSEGRVLIEALPDRAETGIVESVGTWWDDAVSNVAGEIVTEGISAFVPSKDRQTELDDRIIPGIPSAPQFYFIGAVLLGLMGWSVSTAWWRRIWPAEDREEYRSGFGYWAARAVRGLVFLLVFLPIVGPFALIAALLIGLYNVMMVPLRWLRALLRGNRGSPQKS